MQRARRIIRHSNSSKGTPRRQRCAQLILTGGMDRAAEIPMTVFPQRSTPTVAMYKTILWGTIPSRKESRGISPKTCFRREAPTTCRTRSFQPFCDAQCSCRLSHIRPFDSLPNCPLRSRHRCKPTGTYLQINRAD